MCVALPGRVVQMSEQTAIVEVGGRTREVSLLALPDLHVGEYVLVSLGMAVERLTREEAASLEGLWNEVAAAQDALLERE